MKDHTRQVKPEQVVQSHTALQSLAVRYGDKPVLALGGPKKYLDQPRRILNGYGFEDVYTAYDVSAWRDSSWPYYKVPDGQLYQTRTADFSKISFAAVLVFHDSRDWGHDIQLICDVLRSPTATIGELGNDTHPQPYLAFAHGDLVWGTDFPVPRFGMGAFQIAARAIYEQMSGRPLEATTFGKPQRLTYEYADGLLLQQAIKAGDAPDDQRPSIWMIGDNPASDILGANDYGWKSALVRINPSRAARYQH